MKFTDNRGHGNKNFVQKILPKKTPEELIEEQQRAIEENLEGLRREELRLNGIEASKARSVDKFRLGFVEEYEEEQAIKMIEDLLGFERPRPTGYNVAVKIYVRDEEVGKILDKDGRETLLYAPPKVSAHDKFRNCSALVLALGPDAYRASKFPSGPWVRVGDWVVIARNGGPQVNYRGVPVTFIPDDNIYCVIEDPTHVTRD